jgi:hypothetical protein
LCSAINLLQEEVDDEESVLRRSGEDRVRMVNEMMGRIADTLKELERVSKKYDRLLGDRSRSKWKRMRDRFRFAVDAPDLDALRNKVRSQREKCVRIISLTCACSLKLVCHNGVMELLLTSVGKYAPKQVQYLQETRCLCRMLSHGNTDGNSPSSSLQRLEATTGRIETQVNEIKDYLRRSETGTLSLPKVSSPPGFDDDDIFKASLSAALLQSSQKSQHWASIGVSDWIGVGRWWLLKVSCESTRTFVALSSYTGIGANGSVQRYYLTRNGNSFPTWISEPC